MGLLFPRQRGQNPIKNVIFGLAKQHTAMKRIFRLTMHAGQYPAGPKTRRLPSILLPADAE